MINLKAYDDEGGYVLQRDDSGELIWVFKAYAHSDEEFIESAMFIPALLGRELEEKTQITTSLMNTFITTIMFKKFDETDLELP